MTEKTTTYGTVTCGVPDNEQSDNACMTLHGDSGQIAVSTKLVVEIPQEWVDQGIEEVAIRLRMLFGAVRTMFPSITIEAEVGPTRS